MSGNDLIPANTRRAVLAALASAAVFKMNAVHAQGYPAKPVKILVPYAPGGAVDIFARLMAKELNALNGQPYVVENKGGAGGAIAAAEVARSAPDGYTILMGATGPNAIVPSVYGAAAGFDPLKDLAPVALLASMPYVLVVAPDLAASSVPELVKLARRNPGKLNYASSGNGGPDHLAGELFKQLTGIESVHVPYKGSGPALADIAGGQVQYTFTSPLVAMPLVEARKVRVLAVTAKDRTPGMPDLPTVAESVPGFELMSWYGFFLPAGTAQPIANKVAEDVRRIFELPELRQTLRKRGVEPQTSSPAEFAAFVRSDIAKWSKVVRDAGIKAE